MIPLSLAPAVEKLLEKHTGIKGRIEETRALGGGSINDCCKLVYARKSFFMKWNYADRYPQMFVKEALGLEKLSATNSIKIPEVIGTGEEASLAFLILSYVEKGHASQSFWHEFGTQLAQLHKNTAAHFGLNHDNFIGSLEQKNSFCDNWPEFFAGMRLEPQIRMARNRGAFDSASLMAFERLFGKLDKLFPAEAPALLHGDLWSGNFLCNEKSAPVLIDPAIYYGHREMDLAMSKLFGGFDNSFYTAYHSSFPLEKGWQTRVDLCNIYPLLVHVNLFGGGYVSQVKSILRYFAG
ncbi:MAG: fructosamine kinase family protein [Bacteroidales bacterium]|nr:fructosamine kinase family protein [Bacteroidales bacterium]